MTFSAPTDGPRPGPFLGFLGLRVSEDCSIDIEDLGTDRGHRTVTVIGKGSKLALLPLPPRVARALELAAGRPALGAAPPASGRHAAQPPRRHPDHPAPGPAGGNHQAHLPELPAPQLHRRRPGRRGGPARRPDRRPALRPPDHDPIRPGQEQPGPPRQLHRHRLCGRGGLSNYRRASGTYRSPSARTSAASKTSGRTSCDPRRRIRYPLGRIWAISYPCAHCPAMYRVRTSTLAPADTRWRSMVELAEPCGIGGPPHRR